MNHMQRKSIQGFTLIEMLIVIAVISILAGIVLVGITGFQETARDTKRIGDLRGVQNSLELFYTRCGHYPVDGNGCGGTGDGPVSWSVLADSMFDVGIITSIDKLPGDPKDPDNNQYAYGSDGFGYVLRATLENRSSALEDKGVELDDTLFTIECGDDGALPFYCIGSS